MMVLVTGGASSGKSAYAESAALELPGPHYYLAAMKPFGADGARRIARHRELRAGKGFVTVECYDGLDAAAARISPECGGHMPGTALLECLGNVVANELFDDDGAQAAVDDALASVLAGVSELADLFDNFVIVGNEVGCDGVRYDSATAAYISILGTASCELAQRCDTVVECTCGQPVIVK